MQYRIAGVLILIGALACPVAGWQKSKSRNQAGDTEAANTEREADSVLQNMLLLLQYLEQNSLSIENIPDRVRALLEIADTLWLLDAEQAREVFKLCFELANDFDNSLDETRRRASGAGLRNTVITRIANHDPKMADKLVSDAAAKSGAQETNTFGRLYGSSSPRGEVLLEAATQMLLSDPNKALELARLTASEGFSQNLRLFLLKLRSKDQLAADALFETIFRVASMRRPKELIEALFIWDYAFQKKSLYFGSVGWFRESKEIQYPVTPDISRRALTFAFDTVIENAQSMHVESTPESERPLIRERFATLHSVASQILPDVQKYMPMEISYLQSELQKAERELTAAGRKLPAPLDPIPQSPATEADADKLVEKLIERASSAPNTQARDGFYAQAVLRLYLHGQYQRALELSSKVESQSLALMLTEPIKFDHAGVLIDRRELESALAVARSLETLELRVTVLARLAIAYNAAKKQTQAVELLSEAEIIAAKASPSTYLVSGLLNIALISLEIDWNRGLEAAYAALRTANTIKEGDLWDFIYAGCGTSGRLKVQSHSWSRRKDGGLESFSVVYPRATGLVDLASKISESNLNEALLLAELLKHKSQSFAAQAVICRQPIKRAQTAKKGMNKGKARSN